MKVTASYARAHLSALLKAVQRGKTVTISHYGRPVADLAPSKQARKPPRKFGTLKGKVKIVDANWAAPMTTAEVDAFIEEHTVPSRQPGLFRCTPGTHSTG